MLIRLFIICTKMGQRVDNIQIMAANLDEAERRLRQMYLNCEIIEAPEQSVARRNDSLDVEHVIGLISASPSGHKTGTQ
jgi:hypothetical protein